MGDFDQVDDLILLTLMSYGEARGEPLEGIAAVCHVALNRVKQWKRPLHDILLQEKQFSCFNPDNLNYPKLVELATTNLQFGETGYRKCWWMAKGCLDDFLPDPTKSSNHYLTLILYRSDRRPTWADPRKETVRIGNHVFLKL